MPHPIDVAYLQYKDMQPVTMYKHSINWTPELRDFIQNHLEDDTVGLLLSAHKYEGIDVPFAVEQIEARRRLRTKLPEWYGNAELMMGGRVAAEQCSSEVVARYKRGIIEGESLCEVAKHNFAVLADGRHPEVEVRCGDGRLMPIPQVDVIYVDPARRSEDGGRVYAIEDCEPDVTVWQDELMRHARMVMVKLSPMVDVTDVLRKMKNVAEIHILAVRNECKEILVKLQEGVPNCMVHCVDFFSAHIIKYSFVFAADGAGSSAVTDRGVMRYLYEPDVTLMKAGAWGDLCSRFPICQLDRDTRLMTADELIENFPGRIFIVEEQMPFSSKVAKRLKRSIPQANIAARNFIMTADELRRRTGIKDGGEVYLFGAKVNNFGYMLLKCSKISLPLHR